MEQSVGVFGEEILLWTCLLRQSPVRPPAEHVHRQANFMLDELKGSQAALGLPVQSVDDGLFAIAALLDEVAMTLPDLRPLWSARLLQAVRWNTNNAGAELFERLKRVRTAEQSRPVLATYYVVLGCGFMGKYALPGAVRYELEQTRRDLARALGVDPDRDWKGGALRTIREDEKNALAPSVGFVRSAWMGRIIALLVFLSGLSSLLWAVRWALA